MTCIYCFRKILSELSWGNIITGTKKKKLCSSCINSFLPLNPLLCEKCSTESRSEICSDCIEWSNRYNNEDVLTRNYSAFKYNEFTQKYLARWKYQGDFILIDGIKELTKIYIKENLNFIDETYTIIPIPLSEERIKERAFNQATSIAKLLGEVEESFLTQQSNEKQSKKTKKERIGSINYFKVHNKLTGKVLLVDDIYTTGTTVRHAATLLLENGASEVSSFTFIRS